MTAPPLGRLRLATLQDVSDIYELINESMAKNFRISRVSDVVDLIECATLSVVQTNKKNEVVGFLAAKDHPLLPSLHPSAWENYIWTKYKTVEMTARNTLFIHLLCWYAPYGRDVVDSLLKSLFMHDSYLMNVAMIKCVPKYPLLMPGQNRCEGSFRRVSALSAAERGVSPELVPVLFLAERSEVCRRLRVRRAVEEDNDDLVPIIDQHSTRLREMYGEFYISELISRHPESERILLVGERQELAVGVMILNTMINYEALEESFDLSPFAGLRQLDAEPIVHYANLSSEMLENMSEKSDVKIKKLKDPASVIPNSVPTSDKAELKKAHWGANGEADFLDEEVIVDLPMVEDDDDVVEYDIVNISHELMRIPRPISVELNIVFEYGYDILQVAFEMFPDRDYCVLCLPSDQPAFPLLEHFTLVAPKHYREKYTNQSLYVAHVNSVRENVAVRKAEAYDVASMTHILEHVTDKEHILKLLEKSLVSDALDSFVLLSQRQAVGVVILGTLDNCVGVRTQYNLEPEPRHPGTDGAILAGILSPALEPHARWYLRDLIRQSKFYHLFWPSQLATSGCFSSRNVMSLAGRMVPVVPYRHCDLGVSGNKDLHKLMSLVTICPLWGIETHLTALPKVDVNNGIVVVGASRTGLAFIETLLMGPASHYLTFTNITLVSEHGLPLLSESMPAAETCVPGCGRYTDRYLKSLPMNYYVDCLTGVMVEIDRKQKFIRLKGGVVKYYDELVLTCGKQFQHPHYLAESFAHSKQMSKGQPCERMLMDNPKYQPDKVPPRPELPENVFIINSVYEANICLRRLMSMIRSRRERLSAENRVIVYGDCLESYSTMTALLELGLDPQEIAFVEPFPPLDRSALRVNCFNDEVVCIPQSFRNLYICKSGCERLRAENRVIVYGHRMEANSTMAALLYLGLDPQEIKFVEPFPSLGRSTIRVNCFNEEVIDERVQASLNNLGIHVYRECHFVRWRTMGSWIFGLDVMSPLHSIFIPCFAFFYYGLKAINYYAFKAISECGLVYDGGLVLDTKFKTNDAHVYGAGTCVQYSRRLRADEKLHRHRCSEDVGEALANIFLCQMDPFVMADEELDLSDHLPRYRSSLLNSFPHPSIEQLNRPSLEKNRKWEPVMDFVSPVIQSATFPGPLYYLQLKAPVADVPMEVRLTLPHQGHLLTTDKNGNYFELRLDEFHCIDRVTCLAKTPPCFGTLTQLHGIHESMFNNLLARYMMNKIDDFYEFFMQPWMTALFRESFGNVLRFICRQNVGTVYDLIKSHFSLFTGDKEFLEEGNEVAIIIQKTPSCSTVQTCYSERSCFFCAGDAPNLGTVRSVIERFIPVSAENEEDFKRHFPSECGQSTALRNDAKAFWNALGGERIVTAHLARYLDRNHVFNTQYATIRPDLL